MFLSSVSSQRNLENRGFFGGRRKPGTCYRNRVQTVGKFRCDVGSLFATKKIDQILFSKNKQLVEIDPGKLRLIKTLCMIFVFFSKPPHSQNVGSFSRILTRTANFQVNLKLQVEEVSSVDQV